MRIFTNLALAVLLSLLLACNSGGTSTVEARPAPEAKAASPTSNDIPPAVPVAKVDGERAMGYTREIVAFGSRPAGSPAHQKLEAWLHTKLRGVSVEEDVFTASTPKGKFAMRNIIAKLPGAKDGIIVVAGHYDTNYPLKNFVGANDGGSSTGLLLELTNVLREQKRTGYSIWMVWFDGEEAFHEWSKEDSLYGSRHLAEKWERDGTLKKIKAFLLLDMIGDSDLNIDRDSYSTPWLLDVVQNAASRRGVQSYFFRREIGVADDHLPFADRGVPVADVIDLDYGPDNAYHHTSQDTLDKLSPRSFEVVGNTILETIQLLNGVGEAH